MGNINNSSKTSDNSNISDSSNSSNSSNNSSSSSSSALTMDPPPLNPDPGKPPRLRLSASLESKFGPRVRREAEAGREDRSASETRRGRRARTLSYEVKVSTKFCGTQYFRKAPSPC